MDETYDPTLARIVKDIKMLRLFPLLGKIYEEIDSVTFRLFVSGKYLVFYHVGDTAKVIIDRVLHSRQYYPIKLNSQ